MTQNNRPAQRRPAAKPAAGSTQARRPAPVRRAPERAARPTRFPRPAQAARAEQTTGGETRQPAVEHRPAAPRMPDNGKLFGFLPTEYVILLVACLLFVAGGVVLQYALPDGFVLRSSAEDEVPVSAAVSEIHSGGPLRLNEIMTSNNGALMDKGGKTPDWVEVSNISDRAVSLEGYMLARSAKASSVFVFPAITLDPGGCVLVYADGQLLNEQPDDLHAPFRLSSGGDVLMLFNDAKVAVDTVNIPAVITNSAYVRLDQDTWTITSQVTPGLANTRENYDQLNRVADNSSIQLAEIMASNTKYHPDESGVYQDYILLRNVSGENVDLFGWFLSDNPDLPRKWRFPEGTVIPAGGTLRVYASGLDRVEDPQHLHTNFRLSSEGETITLSTAAGRAVDQVTFDLLRTDTAYIRGADNTWSVGTPAS